jgi:hypothetical protein
MGRALERPIAVPRGTMMGFATLYLSHELRRVSTGRRPKAATRNRRVGMMDEFMGSSLA